ncbi:hypothetical protein ACPA0F_09140 [Solibacillus silvestris]
MAENERLGASFAIDISALQAGLKTANKLIRESQSEFKAAAAGMDDWTQSEEGLKAKIKSLNDITKIQEAKVAALTDSYEELVKNGLDPSSDRAVYLRTQINNEKAALEKNKSELKKQERALEDLSNSSDDAADALKDTGEAAKEAGDGFTIAKGAAADLIANGISKLAGACKNAISSIAGLADSTKESREAFAKLDQSFETAGLGAESAEKTMNDLYGILGDTDKATEASNLLAKMSKNQKDLDKNTRILTGVYAEYGDSIPTEGLAEGMQATAQMGKVQGVLADALEWQGVNLDEYNEKLGTMSSAEERASYIQETLTALYGDSADSYRENNKELIKANEAQLEQNKTLNDFGALVEPLTTKVREGFNKILKKVYELTEDVDFAALGEKIDQGFDKFLNDIMPKIIEGFEWILDNKDLIIAGITGIGAAFVAFKVVGIIQGVTNALEGMTLAQAALNFVMSLNPIALVIAAIVGLVAAFVVLWKKCDGFREFWIDLWEKLKSGASDAWEGTKKIFSKVASFFGDVFGKAWEGVKKVFSTGGKVFDGIKEGIVSAFKATVNAIIKGINKVVAVPFRGLNTVLDKIQKVSVAGIKPFDWISWRAPIPEIPQLAKGGLVKRATTAVIGEDGKEAIVPLERNTEWIDAVAEKIGSKTGVVVNQTNNYSQAHSRYEIYKSKQQTAAAVRLALGV